MAQNRVNLPPAVTNAVELIEARIKHLQSGGEGQEQFETGMIFGLREAEACLLQGLVSDGKAPG